MKKKYIYGSKKRILLDLLILCFVVGGYFWYTHWTYKYVVESEHYKALSNISINNTKIALSKAEILYQTYTEFWSINPDNLENKLRMKFYEMSLSG